MCFSTLVEERAFMSALQHSAEPQPKAKPFNAEQRSKQRKDEESQKLKSYFFSKISKSFLCALCTTIPKILCGLRRIFVPCFPQIFLCDSVFPPCPLWLAVAFDLLQINFC